MNKIIKYTFLALVTALLAGCANSISPPSGGPKDVTPPKVVRTHPANNSANFSGDKFELEFDEFIKLDNITSSALISPPSKELPDFRLKGKKLLVKFKNELLPNTTYSVYFGDAIIDITESNPLKNYNYIFSTGTYVDSLSFVGKVVNSFNLTPVEDVYVMLYKDNNDTISFDSLPYFVPPYYLTRTNAAGKFRFNGLSNDKFLAFALNDQNSSLFFDQPAEDIAFLDSFVQPYYIGKPVLDSARIDSLISVELLPDTILTIADSLLPDSLFAEPASNAELMLFVTPDTTQRLLKTELVAKNKIVFSFSRPAKSVLFESIGYPFDSTMFVEETNTTGDTIIWHLNNPPTDSLHLIITHLGDTLRTVYLKLDPSKKRSRVKKNDTIPPREYLTWNSNIKASKLDLNKIPVIEFDQPMVQFNNTDSSLIVIGNDSIWDPEFTFTDSIKKTIKFPINITEETPYRIYFPDSAFSNWNNIYTGEIDIKFSTPAIKEYGELSFELLPTKKQNYIFQLMNDKDDVIKEIIFNNDTIVNLEYLKSASYGFKIIFDNNANGKWDAGDFGQRLQPEKVIFYPKKIKVRANWEIEEDWKF